VLVGEPRVHEHREVKASQLIAQNTQKTPLLHEKEELLDKS
jgi:hypothetical protein